MPRRKALGKGLSALIPDAEDFDQDQVQFFMCPVDAIEANPYQPRQEFSPSELDEMVLSVKEKGIVTPLLVSRIQGGGYQLIAGERRWRAAQKAGLERIPVIVREATPLESLELALVENIHRKDLNPIEEATAYRRLLEETRVTQDALAKKLGKDRTSITNLLRLLRLPRSIQNDIINGRVHMGHARVLAGLSGQDDQRALRDAIVQKGLSVRQAEAWAKRNRVKPRNNPPSQKDAYLESLADRLKRSLGTKVEIRRRGNRGRIILHFYSDGELDRLLDSLG